MKNILYVCGILLISGLVFIAGLVSNGRAVSLEQIVSSGMLGLTLSFYYVPIILFMLLSESFKRLFPRRASTILRAGLACSLFAVALIIFEADGVGIHVITLSSIAIVALQAFDFWFWRTKRLQ